MWYAGSRASVRLSGLSPLPEDDIGERAEELSIKADVHHAWDDNPIPSTSAEQITSGPGPPEDTLDDLVDDDGDSGHPLPDELDRQSPVGFRYLDDDDSGHPLSEPAQSLPDLDEVGQGFVPRRRRVGLTVGASFESSWSTLDSSGDDAETDDQG